MNLICVPVNVHSVPLTFPHVHGRFKQAKESRSTDLGNLSWSVRVNRRIQLYLFKSWKNLQGEFPIT